jgi:hypothetical protein
LGNAPTLFMELTGVLGCQVGEFSHALLHYFVTEDRLLLLR